MIFCIKKQSKPFKNIIHLPGDKSIAQRAIILCAIADGESCLTNIPLSDDCLSAISCINQLGIHTKLSGTTLLIKGKGLYGLKKPSKAIQVGESGTLARLLTGLLCAQKFSSVLTGKKTLLNRPMERVIRPLRQMGAIINSNNGMLPLRITPSIIKPICYKMPVASAQVKSAILLSGLYTKGKTIVKEPIPTRDHTERLLELMGTKRLKLEIPGDFSSSAYFIAAALLIPDSQITIKNVGLNLYRLGLLTVLKKMGARIWRLRRHGASAPSQIPYKKQQWTEPVGDIIVKYSFLKGIRVSGKIITSLIDEIPILSLLATQSKGMTIIKDASELKVKESNRLKAVADELSKLGADIRETNDGLIIKGPTRLYGTKCFSHNDHRIAMMLSIAGLVAQGTTTISNAEVINKSFPSFIEILQSL
jgi:3-phosphoshikimate 1-carboxyvinyltransferase